MPKQWNFGFDPRPFAWTTGDLQIGRPAVGALFHVVDSHPAAVADVLQVKSHAVVADVEDDPVTAGLQIDGHFFGAGVADEVVQRLHRDAIDVGFDGARQADHPVGTQFRFQSRTGFDGFEAGFQRRDQSVLLEQGRIQFQNQQAHFLQGLHGVVLDLSQVVLHLLDIALVGRTAGGGGIETDGVQQLCDRVVQFAGDAIAFFEGGQILRLFVEAGVLNGDGDLVGDGLRKTGVGLGVVAWLFVGETEQARHLAAEDERDADPRARMVEDGRMNGDTRHPKGTAPMAVRR